MLENENGQAAVELTKEQLASYLNEGAFMCPNCHSTDIDGGPLDGDGDHVWQKVDCNDCHAEWTDEYRIASVEADEGKVHATMPAYSTHAKFFSSLSEEEQLWLLEVAHTALDWSDMQERIGDSMDLADEPLEALHAKIGVYLAAHQ